MKKLFVFLVVSCCSPALYAQNFPELLKQNMARYQKANPYSVNFIFNQPVYSPGDTALYSVSVWNASQSKADVGRRLVEVSVWDDHGATVIHSKILLLNGFGNSQMVVPARLKPGRYLLTASLYQSDVVAYQQEFPVAGDLELKGPEDGIITAWVEGGQFIEGVPNWISVKANRQAAAGSVVRLKSSGKVIRESKLDSFGGAEFQIRPAKESYSIELGDSDFPLPPVVTGGFVLHYRDDRDPVVEVRTDMPGEENAYLVIAGSDGQINVVKLNSADTLSRISVPVKIKGLIQAVVIDESYKVWARRWFIPGSMSQHTVPEIALNKKSFQTREKVDLKVTAGENTGYASVRVLKKDLFGRYLINGSGDVSIHHALLSRTSDIVPWSALQTIKESSSSSSQYLSLSGQATFSDTGKPLPDSTMLVLFLQKKLFGYESMIRNGQFDIPLVFDVEGDETVFYFATYRKRDLNDIALNLRAVTRVDEMKSIPGEEDEKPDAYGMYSTRKKVIDRSFHYFAAPRINDDFDPNTRFIEELGGVDITVEPRSYVAFASMSEVIREILPALEHRTIKGKEVIRLYTTHKRPTNSAGPLYVIDGVVTKNPINFLDIKPSDVLYIKIVKDYSKLRQLGLLADNGVILVRTRLGEPSFVQEHVFPVEGITRSTASRLYTGNTIGNTRIPDLRPCLYWNPSVKWGDDHQMTASFFTSDDVGEYVIEVSGVDSFGEPFHTTQTFQVVLNK